MNETNLVALLEPILQRSPDRIALIHGEATITYREIDLRTRVIGAFFQAEGVQPGQRALMLVPPGIEFYLIFLGLMRIGITAILIDPAVGEAQISACCRLVPPDLFIGTPKAHLLRLCNRAIRQIPRKFATAPWIPGSRVLAYRRVAGSCQEATTTTDSPALITFTSGSTGSPKAICRTHGFLLQQHAVLCRAIGSQAAAAKGDEVELNMLPIFVLSSLACGRTVLVPSRFSAQPTTAQAAAIVDELQRHRVGRLLAAPAFCQQIVTALEASDQTLPAIRALYTGGGPVFPALYARLQQRLPNATIRAVYGSTEAEPIAQINLSTLSPADQQAMAAGQGLLAGRPIAEIALAILPDQVGQPIGPFTEEAFEAAGLPTNCAGEIVVSGAHVQKAYLGGDDGFSKFQVGETIWHRTGDAGHLDAAGRLWLLGRCTARIGAGATACYPFGMEAAAMSQPDVERAAYVAVNGEGVLAVQTALDRWPAVAATLRAALPAGNRLERLERIPVDSRHGSKVRYDELRVLLQRRNHLTG